MLMQNFLLKCKDCGELAKIPIENDSVIAKDVNLRFYNCFTLFLTPLMILKRLHTLKGSSLSLKLFHLNQNFAMQFVVKCFIFI